MWAENEPLQHLEKTTGSPTHCTFRSSAVILVHIVLQSLLLSVILLLSLNSRSSINLEAAQPRKPI